MDDDFIKRFSGFGDSQYNKTSRDVERELLDHEKELEHKDLLGIIKDTLGLFKGEDKKEYLDATLNKIDNIFDKLENLNQELPLFEGQNPQSK